MTPDWSELVRNHRALVVGVVRRIVGNDADTEDVVQEVFWEAYRASERQVIEMWPGFLRRLATCRAVDLVRARRFNLPIETDVTADCAPGPPAIAVGRELAERLRDGLAVLTPQESQVFCLRYLEELAYEEIAITLSITRNAVGLALHKARKKLQSFLGADQV
jgi:RNA polymerase sigma-70 factor (ECF subfamily)